MSDTRREQPHRTELLGLDDPLFEFDTLGDVVQDHQSAHAPEVLGDEGGHCDVEPALRDCH